MIPRTATLFTKIVTFAGLLYGFSNAVAEDLYQWKDADGTITYSTTPPPANITTKYQEVSKKLNPPWIKPAKPNTTTAVKPTFDTQATPSMEKPVTKKESRLERLVRLSPEPQKAISPEVRDSIVQPVNQDKVRKQRKCRDLSNRVNALEARLRTVSSPDELNESMLLLTKYQDSFDHFCQ